MPYGRDESPGRFFVPNGQMAQPQHCIPDCAANAISCTSALISSCRHQVAARIFGNHSPNVPTHQGHTPAALPAGSALRLPEVIRLPNAPLNLYGFRWIASMPLMPFFRHPPAIQAKEKRPGTLPGLFRTSVLHAANQTDATCPHPAGWISASPPPWPGAPGTTRPAGP